MILIDFKIVCAAVVWQGIFAHSSADSLAAGKVKADNEYALVNFIRHGEKPDKGDGLTVDGQHRALYLSQCMAKGGSQALPSSAPTMLTACAAEFDKSHRAKDTLTPLASALNIALSADCDKSDTGCLVNRVQSMPAGGVMVVAWEHQAIPTLIKAFKIPHDGDFKDWPDHCDSLTWPEPTNLTGSTCYDKIWQVRFSRAAGSSDLWKGQSITALQEGFGGQASSPCAEALAHIGQKETEPFVV